ncbi:FAD-dependent oxidoreductase [Chloroflexota bacterium]
MADKIKLVIDDVVVEAEEGTSVLVAAQGTGIYLPSLCYHPDLPLPVDTEADDSIYRCTGIIENDKSTDRYEGCQLCLVTIDGQEGLQKACSTDVAAGMVVHTNTPEIQEQRRRNLKQILLTHPNTCLTCHRLERCLPSDICLRTTKVTMRCVLCPQNRNCELQRVTDYIGIEEWETPYEDRNFPVERDTPLFDRDYNLCIGCTRCVRMCREVRGIGALGFVFQNGQVTIGTTGPALQESACKFCGACVEVCPTGAIMDRARTDEWSIVFESEEVAVPCQYACPAGINVPLYVYLAGQGKYSDSIAIVREKVPFPGVLGRVCIHPCEEACRRGKINETISIKFLKRFVADHDTGEWKRFSRKLPPTGKQVAVVGSGPAGLTAAYYLAKAGHSVAVFEQFARAGGMMRVGIPDYRLPPEVLDGEIEEIQRAGVEIKLNTRVESIDGLFEQNYDAVFLGLGAHRGAKMGIDGEDTPGVIDGAAFLRAVSLGEKVDVGDKVAVIGGGNVAIDSARAALRLGAKEVSIMYRRTRAEMPASPEEVEAALQENIEMTFLSAPISISQQDGRLILTCNFMELGEPDASGRPRPVPIKGSEFSRDFSAIIGAIGQAIDIPEQYNLKTGRGNTIRVNPDTMTTSREGVWAGGDVVTGPDSVIRAIAAGRKAAGSIDIYLGGNGNIDEELTAERELGFYCGREEGFPERTRVSMPELPEAQRERNFSEVETGLTEAGATAEGGRCFQCGIRLQISPAPLPPPDTPNQTKELKKLVSST